MRRERKAQEQTVHAYNYAKCRYVSVPYVFVCLLHVVISYSTYPPPILGASLPKLEYAKCLYVCVTHVSVCLLPVVISYSAYAYSTYLPPLLGAYI